MELDDMDTRDAGFEEFYEQYMDECKINDPSNAVNATIYALCAVGDQNGVIDLVTSQDLNPITFYKSGGFRAACDQSHSALVAYILEMTELSPDFVLTNSIYERLCVNGYVEIVKILHERFDISFECVKRHNFLAVLGACRRGGAAMVEFLLSKWGMHLVADESFDSPHVLFTACIYNRLAVIKVLAKFGMCSAELVRANDCKVLVAACEHGAYDIVEYFREGYGLTANDICAENYHVLRSAVCYPETATEVSKMVRCLCENFGLTAQDIRDSDAQRTLRMRIEEDDEEGKRVDILCDLVVYLAKLADQ